jgi:hypothetical protein
MNRRPTTQDITWLLDLNRNSQLDLNPPYQRKSVWTSKDRQFFLDTIFRDYPSPAIFLHKTIAADGSSTYHVVDGKQRLETILLFVNNKIRIPKDFGDIRLDGKSWMQLDGELELKKRLWNYQIPVEMVDIVEGNIVNEVFDRLNRNSRRLTDQELRHAKFEGWFITVAESEEEKDSWRKLGIVTTARAKRMADTQFISELLIVTITGAPVGFDQDALDVFYGAYDDAEEVEGFDETAFTENLLRTKEYLLEMERTGNVVTRHARTLAHFYTLWSVITLNPASFTDLATAPTTAQKYAAFMTTVEAIASEKDAPTDGTPSLATQHPVHARYYENSRGASTDLKPRHERQAVLAPELF